MTAPLPDDQSDDHVPAGGEPLGDDPPWTPWTPEHVSRCLAGVPVPWCVVGGWALDLFRGEVTREHEDIEIAVPAGRFALVREALATLVFDVVGAGQRWPLDHPAFDVLHQTWALDPSTGAYVLDVFREPHDGDTWVCRRDGAITMPYADVVATTPAGIPYMQPEIVLLFKAKHQRDKDEADFAGVVDLLTPQRRAWLGSALRRVHPDHHWLPSFA